MISLASATPTLCVAYPAPADGRSPGEPIYMTEFDKRATSVALDGSMLLFSHDRLPDELWRLSLIDGMEQAPEPVLAGAYSMWSPMISPDGRWIAYASDEQGQFEVYVSPYPDVSAARTIVSNGGGRFPRWTKGGRELVYRAGDRMFAVAVDPESGRVQSPEVLFEGPYLSSPRWVHNYDVSPDGERFLMVQPAVPGTRREFVVVLNWLEELKAKVGNQE